MVVVGCAAVKTLFLGAVAFCMCVALSCAFGASFCGRLAIFCRVLLHGITSKSNLDVGEFFYLALFWSYPGVEDGESLLQDFLGHVSSLKLDFEDVCVVFYFDDVFYV